MNIPKKVIGWGFVIVGLIGGMFLGYLQMYAKMNLPFLSKEALLWIYSFIYVGFLATWFALFDYVKKVEKRQCQ